MDVKLRFHNIKVYPEFVKEIDAREQKLFLNTDEYYEFIENWFLNAYQCKVIATPGFIEFETEQDYIIYKLKCE